VHPFILLTARHAWNTLLFRFDHKSLAEYPRQGLSLLVVVVFLMDCLLGTFSAYPFLGVFSGAIMGVLDVVGLLLFLKFKGHAHAVAFASVILAGQLAALVLSFMHLTSLTVIASIWILAVVINLGRAPASQTA
jgi:hypothetical protein